MDRRILAIGVFFGMTAVIIGAFGAHALKASLGAEKLAIFETGVKYQFYHALLLLFVAAFSGIPPQKKKVVLWLITTGIVFFSGSIYLLATDAMNEFDFTRIGIITPIGGTLLIVGWLVLFIEFLRKKS